MLFFFFEQKTAYEMRISDWSSDVCSSDLGLYQVTQRDGARCPAAVAYLDPAKSRPNLPVHTGIMVERILFEGTRATGVACSRRGKAVSYRASREVILSGGSINSPQLLMLSGIGPEAELRRHGIAVVA